VVASNELLEQRDKALKDGAWPCPCCEHGWSVLIDATMHCEMCGYHGGDPKLYVKESPTKPVETTSAQALSLPKPAESNPSTDHVKWDGDK
jgi:hypothetical protein